VNYHEYYCKKNEKNLDKNNIFHCELSSIIVFYAHMKEVRFLERSNSSFLLIFKNSTFLKKSVFLGY
jgi:hypothetical protein